METRASTSPTAHHEREDVVGDTDRKLPTTPWGVLLVGGIIAIILGILVVFNPFDSVRFLTVVVGIALVVAGIFGIIGAMRGTSGIGWAGPAVALIGGIILIVFPETSVKTAAIVVGLIWLAFGIVTIVVAIAGRGDDRWAPLLAGMVLAVLGIIVIVWPGPTLAIVAVLVGIAVLIAGIGMVAQALRARNNPH